MWRGRGRQSEGEVGRGRYYQSVCPSALSWQLCSRALKVRSARCSHSADLRFASVRVSLKHNHAGKWEIKFLRSKSFLWIQYQVAVANLYLNSWHVFRKVGLVSTYYILAAKADAIKSRYIWYNIDLKPILCRVWLCLGLHPHFFTRTGHILIFKSPDCHFILIWISIGYVDFSNPVCTWS